MVGIILITGVSWLLFYYLQHKNLLREWFLPLTNSLESIAVGSGILFFSFSIPLLVKSLVYSLSWSYSPSADIFTIASAFWFYAKSVLTEEMIFRGALLSLLAHYTSDRKSILISALCFGVYHWFSYGMFGSGLIPMLYILMLTGSFGLVWGYMYIKTNSIVLPSVFHLGWNFSSSLFYEYQPFGELLFINKKTHEVGEFADFLIQFGLNLFAILCAFVLFKFYLAKKSRQTEPA